MPLQYGVLSVRKRRKRLWVLSSLTGVFLMVFSAQYFIVYQGGHLGGRHGYTLSDANCHHEPLPPSVQLHCQMYHNNLITGSLCAALCDERAICDVRKVHGNAHKEVMVTKCQGFCRQGQSVQAFLKHDEISATESDYKEEYSKRNDSSSHVTEETFITLLKKHLPIKSLQAFDSNAFLDILWDDKVSEVLKRERAQNAFTSSVYNTLLFLLRQKEYVLFRAFQNSGVFPMVYGTCGPLYLVESCQRLLPEKLSRNSVTNGLQQGGFQTSSYHNDQGSSIENNAVYVGGYEEQKRIDLRAQPFIPKENRLNQKGFSVSSDKTISIEPAVFGSAGTSRQDSGHGPSISSRSISSIENTKLDVGAGSHQRATQNPVGSGLWPTRATAAIKILQLLEKIEDVFSGTVHLCDPKLEHFAVSSLDGETRLIDADNVLFERGFDRPREPWGEQDNVCNNHEECNDVLCRGWCYSNTGRCSLERTNNNLQGVCEVVFLQPSLESGIFLKDVPPSIYTDLFNTVCACAKKQRPLPELRAKLVGIFQRSLKGEETSVAFKHFYGESSNFPRVITYENC
ncbi:hypothetical protein BaRGS_00031816 [Batillaria attramentaria]|uniref:FAM69 N-terminal domain-containing protein n=1 Tax=Batillaria attramentaria TaxID=370345 RepID=A0ABD0JQZ9_9CAEN